MNSFTEKKLEVTIRLADDSNTVFQGSNSNTLVIDKLRVAASVAVNARQATEMQLNIWGMRETDMDALTSAWADPTAIRNNVVILKADTGDGYRTVFTGSIIEAQPDFRRAPDVPLQILGMLPYFYQVNTAEPLSYQGAVDIDVIGRYVADKLGMSYLNLNAKGVVTDPYYAGSVFDQLRDACVAARVNFYFQGDTLVLTPLEQAATDIPAVVLSPTTGLIGYPMYGRRGLTVTAIYDPAFQCGSPIEIVGSSVKGANGRWYPYFMDLNLSANLPGGPWIATMQCTKAAL